MIDNCLLVIIYRRGHILEFSVTAESISRSQDCLSVKSCVDTVICNLKLRENAILTFAPIRNIWIKTREPRLKKLICVKILTCQKWNLGEIWYFSWRAAAARELGRAGKIQTDVEKMPALHRLRAIIVWVALPPWFKWSKDHECIFPLMGKYEGLKKNKIFSKCQVQGSAK